MNIAEAKEQIKRTVTVYLRRDRYGEYRIPLARQRPVFLLGAPGIGKTAIMEQIAQELDIALVSYSMTHHTRQSALGLPVIRHTEYGGQSFDVTEYTMSEIIAAVYEAMEKSGKKEGILFLDEINCVSETLAPAMLQFLQYKTFGTHRVPDGWIIVTAGNPPQFNRAVREFDVAMLDRLKLLEVEPDCDVWRAYAAERGVHSAILTYLEIRKDDFYRIENTPEGKLYTTARGWEDLSETMTLYEELGYPVDETLISQYIRTKSVVREFAAYYALYRKYREDYRIPDILAGKADESVRARAAAAGFDERLSLIGLLTDAILRCLRENVETERILKALLPVLKEVKAALAAEQAAAGRRSLGSAAASGASSGSAAASGASSGSAAAGGASSGSAAAGGASSDSAAAGGASSDRSADISEKERAAAALAAPVSRLQKELERQRTAGALSAREDRLLRGQIRLLEELQQAVRLSSGAPFEAIRAAYGGHVQAMQREAAALSAALTHLFSFVGEVFEPSGNEMLLLVTNLTASYDSAYFLSQHPCEAYFTYSRQFEIYGREKAIGDALSEIDLRALDEADDADASAKA